MIIIPDNFAINLQAEKDKRSFKSFVTSAWHIIEPGRPFVPGWHLDAISEHLQAVYSGQIMRLLVNMPPRHGKSSLITVLWSTWLLLNNPAIRLLCGSYALNLATRDNLKARRIIKSPWFQERYGDVFSIIKDQDAKLKFETDQLGYRMVTSTGSGTTGEGGDGLILDDPHNINEKESDVKRDAAIDWFDNTWSSRLNDVQTSFMVVVAHRIHMRDVSGHILDSGDEDWVHLNLPAEYNPKTKCVTFLKNSENIPKNSENIPKNSENILKNTNVRTGKLHKSFPEQDEEQGDKCSNGSVTQAFPEQDKRENFVKFWQDPRTEEKDLLWPERFPREAIEKARKRHGPLGYSALFDQNPIPPGGFIFNRENERLFTLSPEQDTYLLITPNGVKAVRIYDCWEVTTSDVAAKEKEINDYTVFAQWAITPDNDVLLLDVQRGHWTTPKQKEQAKQFYRTHYTQRYRALYFEDVGYQSAIGQDLLVEGIPCMEFRPEGDKVMRAGGASIWQEVGKVYFLKNAAWLEEWCTEIYSFPKASHDDQVDNLSMICMIVRKPEVGPLDDEVAQALSDYIGY